jgi:hypothetical protein
LIAACSLISMANSVSGGLVPYRLTSNRFGRKHAPKRHVGHVMQITGVRTFRRRATDQAAR